MLNPLKKVQTNQIMLVPNEKFYQFWDPWTSWRHHRIGATGPRAPGHFPHGEVKSTHRPRKQTRDKYKVTGWWFEIFWDSDGCVFWICLDNDNDILLGALEGEWKNDFPETAGKFIIPSDFKSMIFQRADQVTVDLTNRHQHVDPWRWDRSWMIMGYNLPVIVIYIYA